MDWMYLFYFFLATLIFFGAKSTGRGNWNEEYTSLKQTKILQGITALGIALHHMAQKTCAPWHPRIYMVHGLDPFIPMGYMLVSVFLFCSGLGLYKSWKIKPGYLKGFFRRRILPIIIAFYLSEIIYTAVRLAMGEKMDTVTVLWYLSGLHMANFNAWYAIVIPFFYLVFWAAFRFCRREWLAISLVILFVLGYTALGAAIDHQNDWWMRGEWWYNSAMLFPLGMIFGKHEAKITKVLKKGYWFWLILFFAGFFLLYQQSEWLIGRRLGYYVYGPDKVVRRMLSAGTQWVVGFFYTGFWFLMMMKIRLGNRVTAWLGAVTLDFYLMHGIFVELFGYNFLDIAKSIYYIKNVPLYIAAVLAASVPSTLLFRWIRIKVTEWTQKKERPEGEPSGKKESLRARLRRRKKERALRERGRVRSYLVPAVTVLFLLGFYFALASGRNKDEHVFVMNRLEIRVPVYFSRERADERNALFKCTGEGKKASYLIADERIPDASEREQGSLESLESCEWLTEQEAYTNPQGVRMIRGIVITNGIRERRYYIECENSHLMVIRMSEDDRYYNVQDCEEAMRQTADSIRPAK